VGYEAQLWQMADALRGSMDAAPRADGGSMASAFTEPMVVSSALASLEAIGFPIAHWPETGPGTPTAARADYGWVMVAQPLRDALARFDPD
jgi:hypothetical protein